MLLQDIQMKYQNFYWFDISSTFQRINEKCAGSITWSSITLDPSTNSYVAER